MMRRAAKIDRTQTAIVDALRRIGVSVEIIGKPLDLLACHRGETMLIECKAPGGGFTQAQVEFIGRWPGRIIVARNADEAIREVLGKAMCD